MAPFIQATTHNDSKICLNIDHVVSIVENSNHTNCKSQVYMITGLVYNIKESVEEIFQENGAV